MQGWKIFVHALRMVLRNWREALRIAAVPAVLGAAILLVLGQVMPVAAAQTPDGLSCTRLFWGMVMTLLWALTFIWMLVNWHRFVLLAEYPAGWVPAVPRAAIGAYVWRTLQMMLIAMVTLVPVLLLNLMLSGSTAVLVMIWIGAALYGGYRVSPVFPAAAVGKNLSLVAAWNATWPGAGALVIVIILTLVLTQAGSVIEALLAGLLPMAGVVLSMILTAALGLLNASIVTTIYGYYVEGRALTDDA